MAPTWELVTGRWSEGELTRLGRVVARESLVTDEGEYALRAVLEVDGDHVTAGVVFADDRYALSLAAQLSAQAVRACRLGLPSPRRRRFLLAPPPGWEEAAEGVWHRGDSLLVVYPAQPSTGTVTAEVMARHLRDKMTVATALHDTALHRTAGGLEGMRVDLDGEDGRVAQVVVLETGPYLYPLRLECHPADFRTERRCFERVLDSIVPLPHRARSVDMLEHWIE